MTLIEWRLQAGDSTISRWAIPGLYLVAAAAWQNRQRFKTNAQYKS